METILASIRRIISEEEPTQPTAAAGHDVLELDESMVVRPDPPPAPSVAPAARPFEPPPDMPATTPVAAVTRPIEPSIEPGVVAMTIPVPPASDRLLAPDALNAATRAFDALADASRQDPEPAFGQSPALLRSGGPSLEDIVRDELRGQLKAWLDANLAPLVERLVQKEIDELRRRG